MPESPLPIHFQYNDGTSRTKVVYADGDSEELLLTQVDAGLFRLEESSVLDHGYYHDLIRGEVGEDGSLNFHYIAEPSGLHTLSWILSKHAIESDEFRSILSDLMAVGGSWERLFGGLLHVHVPTQQADSFKKRIEQCVSGSRD